MVSSFFDNLEKLMQFLQPKDRIILPLDVSSLDDARRLVESLRDYVGCFKIGLEFITHMLASVISGDSATAANNLGQIRALFELLNHNFFWDGKWDDIPATVGGAAAALTPLKPKMVNIHASAGYEAMKKMVANAGDTLTLAVTVLTSLDTVDCQGIFGADAPTKVKSLALQAASADIRGIICSPQELSIFQTVEIFKQMQFVTPGVRPAWASTDDQKRAMSPGEAIRTGATYLVIGRPITKPPKEIGSPIEAAKRIADEIAEALAV